MENIKTIIISRTDSIGDVVLTLPVAHVIKQKFPDSRIIFLGKSYTKPVLECCLNVNEIICWDEVSRLGNKELLDFFKSLNADCIVHVFPNRQVAALAKKAKIPVRIGTSHRLFHWFTCNKLPGFTRKGSELHEAQLNFKLLEPLGIGTDYSLRSIQDFFEFTKIKPLNNALRSLIDENRYNLILHPKSKGSAQEWGLDNFSRLIQLLPKDKFKIFITGTQLEGDLVKPVISENAHVTNMTGKMNLSELISFINHCDGLVAASTGPLHLSAILGKRTIGIYPSVRPIHPGRWAPVGRNASFLVSTQSCASCTKGDACNCLSSVKPEGVAEILMRDLK